MEDWITTSDAAKITGYDVQHIRKLARDGDIAARKWGREWMISESSILDYLEKFGRGPREISRES